MAQASVKSDAEIEEDEARQKAIDVTERKMFARLAGCWHGPSVGLVGTKGACVT